MVGSTSFGVRSAFCVISCNDVSLFGLSLHMKAVKMRFLSAVELCSTAYFASSNFPLLVGIFFSSTHLDHVPI